VSTFPHRALVLVAAVALVDADGRVLIAKRPEGKAMAGMWEFPGGKVEAGERPELALIRELNLHTDQNMSLFGGNVNRYVGTTWQYELYAWRK